MTTHLQCSNNPLAPVCNGSHGRIVTDLTQVDCALCMVAGIENMSLDDRKALLERLQREQGRK